MPIYVKIEPKEELAIKKAILESDASAVSAQNNVLKLSKLKAGKKSAMTGMATLLQEMQEELEKIKQALPSLEKAEEIEKEKKEKEAKAEIKIKPAKQVKKQTRKMGYESELEALKEKISTL